MIDWFAEDFGTHMHEDPNGSWIDAEEASDE